MGMAASQARFLGLTARKNNVEYEGQQINQQRTTLGNQSANYYNNLLGMSVPVPPSIQDYTKTVYSFQDGNLTNSITSLIAQNNGEFKVSYVSSWQNDFAPVAAGTSIISRAEFSSTNYDIEYDTNNARQFKVHGGNWVNGILYLDGIWTDTNESVVFKLYEDGSDYVTTDNLTRLVSAGGRNYDVFQNSEIAVNNGTGVVEAYNVFDNKSYRIGNTELRLLGKSVKYGSNEQKQDNYLKTLSEDELKALNGEELQYISLLTKKYGYEDGWMVRYIENTSSGVFEPTFYNLHDLQSATYNENGLSQSALKAYKMGSTQETEEVKGVDARLEKDATGRYINITLKPQDGVELTYALTTSTITDQDAYNDAMNQYEFDKATYDNAIQEINAKIEIVQAEDKNLELRLKQLDTEQDAIQTEMDAVQKVIEKNTESSFKTFG